MAVTQTLSVTQVAGSLNHSANTSKVRILWQSTQTGDSWNGYTKTAKYYVSVNGGAETVYSVSYTLPKSTTKTIVDATITVTHNNNGAGTVKVRTWMDTGISAGVVEKTQTITLTTIPRASAISYVSSVTLGNLCTVKWTPLSKDFYYKLKFVVGDWSLTTAVIHPNITTLYTNASYGISLEAAKQFINSKDADMTVTLYTYSDKECTKQIGSPSTETCKVYIPENESTLPKVLMNLSPVSNLAADLSTLYIQGKSKVKANFNGTEGKYNATIKSYTMSVNGKSYDSPYESDTLYNSGKVVVTGKVTDSRGLYNTKEQEITVIPYSKPVIVPYGNEKLIVCKRCNADGNYAHNGVYLRIMAGRLYSKVMDGETQKNFCTMRVRLKVDGTTGWGEWQTILAKDSADDVVSAVLEANLSIAKTYIAEIEAIDDIGESSSVLITIPTADVTVHLKAGGKGLAIGKYSEEDNLLECEWDARFNGKLYHQENELNVVIEEGVKGVNTAEGTTVNWYYRKWLNGNMECWCRRNVDINITYAWGTALYYGMTTTINYPFVFTERPITQITCEYGDDEVSLFVASCGTGTNTYATPVMLCRADSKTGVNCNILYNVHGKWK